MPAMIQTVLAVWTDGDHLVAARDAGDAQKVLDEMIGEPHGYSVPEDAEDFSLKPWKRCADSFEIRISVEEMDLDGATLTGKIEASAAWWAKRGRAFIGSSDCCNPR